MVADDLMGDRAAGERHLHHLAACGLHGLAHRLADLVRLPGRDPHATLAVADCDERIESEAPASLHDLGDAIDRDHVLDQAVALALPLAALVAAGTAATAAPPPAPPAPPLRRSTPHPPAPLAVADCDERIDSEPPASLPALGDAIDRDPVPAQAVALALPLAALVAAGTAATAAPRPAPPAPLLRRSTLHAASPGPPGPRRRPPPPPSPRRCGAPRAPPPRCDPALPASPLFPFVLPLKSNPPFPAPSATPLTPPRYL